MSTSAQVAQARLALARRLAILRQDAGFTQCQAAARLRYSRSAVARAEATGVCSRGFCRLAGQLYGAGDELALEHDRIDALAAAARNQAARRAQQDRHTGPPPGIAAQAEESDVSFMAVEATCPSCGKPVAVLVRQSTTLLPLGSPGLPPGGLPLSAAPLHSRGSSQPRPGPRPLQCGGVWCGPCFPALTSWMKAPRRPAVGGGCPGILGG